MNFFNKQLFNNISKGLFIASLGIIAFLALYLRIIVFGNNIGFFSDEICILLNCFERNYLQMFLPLGYVQCMPPFYIIITKFLYSMFGLNEVILKMPTLICAILNIFFFMLLTFKVLKNKFSIIFANLIFCFSIPLIMYCWILKQYQCDALFTILILLLTVKIKDYTLGKKEFFILGLLSIFSILFSYTSAFIICSSVITLAIYKYKQKLLNKELLKNFLFYLIPLAIAVLVYIEINCIPVLEDESLALYWGKSAASSENREFLFCPANFARIKELFAYILLGGEKVCRAVVSIICFIVSIAVMFKKDNFNFCLLSIPVFVAVTMGVLYLYPFAAARVSLYLIPVFILIFAKILDFADFKNYKTSIILFFVLIFSFVNFKGYAEYWSLFHNFDRDFFYYRGLSRAYTKEYIKVLYNTDISKKDYIFCDSGYASFNLLWVYDKDKRFDREKIYDNGVVDEDLAKISLMEKGSIIYFLIADRHILDIYREMCFDWINNNCKILKKYKTEHGTVIKCQKLSKPTRVLINK